LKLISFLVNPKITLPLDEVNTWVATFLKLIEAKLSGRSGVEWIWQGRSDWQKKPKDK